MERKKQGFGVETLKACIGKIKEETCLKDVCNSLLLICMFMFYTLTFFVPRFYGFTEKYAGLIVFVMLFAMALINVNPVEKIRQKDINFAVLVLLVILTGINILIVKSGYGCFFVMADFALVWYISSVMKFSKWQFYLMGILYTGMLVYWFFGVYTWMFADYSSFAMNTNTAATFTVFSILCALIFFESLYEKHRIAGLLITVALIKSLQISLYHRSRGAFIMLVVFMVLRFLIPARFWEKKGFYYAVCVFVTLGSLIFVAFYIWLGTTGVNFRMPFFYKKVLVFIHKGRSFRFNYFRPSCTRIKNYINHLNLKNASILALRFNQAFIPISYNEKTNNYFNCCNYAGVSNCSSLRNLFRC